MAAGPKLRCEAAHVMVAEWHTWQLAQASTSVAMSSEAWVSWHAYGAASGWSSVELARAACGVSGITLKAMASAATARKHSRSIRKTRKQRRIGIESESGAESSPQSRANITPAISTMPTSSTMVTVLMGS